MEVDERREYATFRGFWKDRVIYEYVRKGTSSSAPCCSSNSSEIQGKEEQSTTDAKYSALLGDSEGHMVQCPAREYFYKPFPFVHAKHIFAVDVCKKLRPQGIL